MQTAASVILSILLLVTSNWQSVLNNICKASTLNLLLHLLSFSPKAKSVAKLKGHKCDRLTLCICKTKATTRFMWRKKSVPVHVKGKPDKSTCNQHLLGITGAR